MIEIDLIGNIVIRARGEPVDIRGAKARALLVALVLARNGVLRREAATELLWPGGDPVRAGASLRQTLKVLRDRLNRLSPGVVSTVGGEIRLAPEACATDLDAAVEAVEAGRVPPALLESLPKPEPLVAGLDGPGAEFDAFLRTGRRRLQGRLSEALRRLLAAGPAGAPAGVDAARALLNLDPTDELAARHLMAHLGARGASAAATGVYYDLRDALAELDAEPTADTDDLLRLIKLNLLAAAPLAALATPALDPRPEARSFVACILPGAPSADPDGAALRDMSLDAMIQSLQDTDLITVFDMRPPMGGPAPVAPDLFVVSRAVSDQRSHHLGFSLKTADGMRQPWTHFAAVEREAGDSARHESMAAIASAATSASLLHFAQRDLGEDEPRAAAWKLALDGIFAIFRLGRGSLDEADRLLARAWEIRLMPRSSRGGPSCGRSAWPSATPRTSRRRGMRRMTSLSARSRPARVRASR